jgi:hypothetical protein
VRSIEISDRCAVFRLLPVNGLNNVQNNFAMVTEFSPGSAETLWRLKCGMGTMPSVNGAQVSLVKVVVFI